MGSSGQIRTKDELDYEDPRDSGGQSAGDNVYEVEVTATHSGGETATTTVAITVTNVCDEATSAPGAPGAPGVSEASTSSLSVSWPPPSTGSCITGYNVRYRRAGNSDQWVVITSRGRSRVYSISELSSGTTYEVQVRARNSEGPGRWSSLGTATTGAAVAPPPPRRRSAGGGGGGGGGGGAPLPTNRLPVFAEGANTVRSVAENTAAGTAVGPRVAARDADRDGLTYSVGGVDGRSFTIDRSSGQLRARSVLDFEAKSRHLVVVVVSDGKGGRAAIRVTIIVTQVDLGDRYDADNSGTIDKDEATAAAVDYFNDRISKDALIEVIKLYFFS